MDKQSSIRLLDETFGQNYNRDRFCRFVKEIFNRFEINVRTWGVWSQYEDYIERFSSLGTFHDKNDKIIEVLEVQLKKTSSRDRARTMQRNFVASFLKKYMKDAALIAFYGDDPSDWRFSFVKMDYNLVRSETGKVDIEKELTPAKRYSYLVGINEPNHTCRRQFLDFVVNDESYPLISDIEDAFSIDTVTKEFFEKYKELVIDLKESLDHIMARDERIVNEFREKGIESIDFAKKLLGQIVFLYFLQKKGWLGVEKDKEWGSGPRDFLRKLFGDTKRGIQPRIQYTNFFNEILEPLFYDALANLRPGDDGYYVHFKCKIPFLNGGLFEPMNDYDWTGPDITIDNLVFEKIFETFDRFNFTVKEDEPLEKEVAVDPEMLGKVFENLLEVKERKDKGAFYTPREIVHYMCQQSLINYLETNTDIKREDIELFIQYGDFALEYLLQDKEKQKNNIEQSQGKEQFLIPLSISNNYRTIDRLLQEIKIVDPAVGSGAFPIGMMNEIVKARSILSVFFPEDEQKNRTNYDFKRETIENSLYGVDIDLSAVEIAKLRFWLSLIVDETKIDTIKPLPNLDHKIMCGNSLLEEFEGIKLFDEKLLGSFKKNKQREIQEINEQINVLNTQLSKTKSFIDRKKISSEIKKLKKKINNLEKKSATDQISLVETESEKKIKKLKSLQKKFFNEQNRDVKRELRAEIDKIEWELIEMTLIQQGNEEALEKLEQYKRTKVKPFFIWKLYFAEVFHRENPGFDVVIANPPYVDSENMVKNMPEEREKIASIYNTASGNWDLYIPFFELGFKLSRENGDLTYIAPNKWLSIGYGKNLRSYFVEYVTQLCNCNSVKVFEAGNTPEIVFIKKEKTEKKLKIHSFDENYNLNDKGNVPRDILKFGNWGMVLSEYLDILLNLIQNNYYLYKYCDVENPFTVSEAYELKKCVYEGKKVTDNEDFKLINTGTIDKYITLWGYKKTSYIKDKYDYPFIDSKKLKNLLPKRYEQSNSIKIIITGIRYFECFFDAAGKYVAGKSTIIIRNPRENITFEALLAILNSSLISFYIREAYSATGIEGGVNFTSKMIEALPLKNLKKSEVEMFHNYSKEIISITRGKYYLDDSEKVEKVNKIIKKIDTLVYNLYNLSEDQINIINNYKKGKS